MRVGKTLRRIRASNIRFASRHKLAIPVTPGNIERSGLTATALRLGIAGIKQGRQRLTRRGMPAHSG